MIKSRHQFSVLRREDQLEALRDYMEHFADAVHEGQNLEYLPKAGKIRAISSTLENIALRSAAESALRAARNGGEVDAHVFFDILESSDSSLTSVQKRELGASAWATGFRQGRRGDNKASNPYVSAGLELGREWDRGWEEGSSAGVAS